jgi:uncharacterized phiE125 gp8 family phage protein
MELDRKVRLLSLENIMDILKRRFTQLSEPGASPIPLADMKIFLRVDHATEDTLIQMLIDQAVKLCESFTNTRYITQEVTVIMDSWPSDPVINLGIGPLISFEEVRTTDSGGTESNADLSVFFIGTKQPHGSLNVLSTADFPQVELASSGAIAIDVTVGYGMSDTDVPIQIRMAIMNLVAWLYENRGDEMKKNMAPMAMPLLMPFRVNP